VHLGILPILGAAGTGKTTVMLRLLKAALIGSKKTVLVCSSTNAAVKNICRSTEAQNSNEDYLYVRLHPEQLEQESIRRYDPSKSLAHGASSGKKSKQREKYHEEGSLARRVLQVARVYDTNCLKLLQLREKHWEIAYILRKSWAERTDQEKENMSRMLKRLEIDLLTSADVVFTTRSPRSPRICIGLSIASAW
jgi:hypothetical protein